MSLCNTCNNLITKDTGNTILVCGHSFHPHCIHNFYRGASCCPICPTVGQKLLDFGDSFHVANATRECVYASTVVYSQEIQKGMIAKLLSPKNTFPAHATPEELVELRAPVQVFKERKISLKDIVKCGVKLKHWFDGHHTLDDLKQMDVKWEDIVYMGLTANDLCNIPAEFLVDVLKVNISHLIQIGTSWQHLVQAKYNARHLLALKCTTHTLINMGMGIQDMSSFGFTDKEWTTLSGV